jgi:undecaprenyl-diphosphatase
VSAGRGLRLLGRWPSLGELRSGRLPSDEAGGAKAGGPHREAAVVAAGNAPVGGGQLDGLALAVARIDQSVDSVFEARFRGRKAIDLVMYGASALGEHSLVWLALAAIESRRARLGWRGFARAAGALSAESLFVNGLVKALFRRRRPEATDPRPLPLHTPLTSSFPSGHASASFFSAAMLRRPGSPWPLYYMVALVVSVSRVHVRLHHASDVVAGAALGALLGELARSRFPLSGK